MWAQVYRVMRCPESCDLGPHCWRDPVGKRHYKLYPHHLRSLIDFVREGAKLECQDDVPKDVRLQLYAEAQQKRDRGSTKGSKASAAMTPITINNHFPDPAQHGSVPSAHSELRHVANVPSGDLVAESLDIPSPLDRAVRDYSDWHKSRVEDPSYKAQVDKARDVVLQQGRDLHQLHNDQDYTFLVEQDVNIGTAKRFVSGISTWAKRRKCHT